MWILKRNTILRQVRIYMLEACGSKLGYWKSQDAKWPVRPHFWTSRHWKLSAILILFQTQSHHDHHAGMASNIFLLIAWAILESTECIMHFAWNEINMINQSDQDWKPWVSPNQNTIQLKPLWMFLCIVFSQQRSPYLSISNILEPLKHRLFLRRGFTPRAPGAAFFHRAFGRSDRPQDLQLRLEVGRLGRAAHRPLGGEGTVPGGFCCWDMGW